MKEKIKELEKLLKDKTTTLAEKEYAEQLITWLIGWIKKGKPGQPSTQDDTGDHPPVPPPHR